ncbi:MAG: UDPGP type 1 family protein [Planctomycetes bacterium]|nr:UDPGP type 1 family protein [Planctomycetota bacterium]
MHNPPDESAIRRRAADAGQDHVFRFWADLSGYGRRRLLEQLAEIDFRQLGRLIERHVRHPEPENLPADLQPAPFIPLPTTDAQRRERCHMRGRGDRLIAAGKVAAFTVAGGQGTRLGYNGPKGAFRVGPVSERPLFQVFAEGILAVRRASGAAIPWYVMTSETNDQATRDFFAEHDYFGLPRGDVLFFRQGMMPAVDFKGRLILSAPDSLARSPDGHGGSLLALARRGMLADMADRGIEHISYWQVDNPLVPPLDPVFLGYHADAGSDMSSKMARKRDPFEKLGNFCLSGDRLHVIEYSDMPDDLAEQTDGEGRLRFEAGSIAIHILARRFVERLTAGGEFALPFHRAEKKIPYVDEAGETVTPDEPNGVKFEMFVFDALPLAENPVVLEIDRAREFSPVKNAQGEDSPATARRDMVRLAADRLEAAGVAVPRDNTGEPTVQVEISPLAARTGEELKRVCADRGLTEIAGDTYIGPA